MNPGLQGVSGSLKCYSPKRFLVSLVTPPPILVITWSNAKSVRHILHSKRLSKIYLITLKTCDLAATGDLLLTPTWTCCPSTLPFESGWGIPFRRFQMFLQIVPTVPSLNPLLVALTDACHLADKTVHYKKSRSVDEKSLTSGASKHGNGRWRQQQWANAYPRRDCFLSVFDFSHFSLFSGVLITL